MLKYIVIDEGEDILLDEGIKAENYSLFGLLGAIPGFVRNGSQRDLSRGTFILVGTEEDLKLWMADWWPRGKPEPKFLNYTPR